MCHMNRWTRKEYPHKETEDIQATMSEHRQKNPTQNVVDFGKTHKDYEMNNSHMFQEVRKYQVYEEG